MISLRKIYFAKREKHVLHKRHLRNFSVLIGALSEDDRLSG